MAISFVGKVATTPGSVVASIDLDLTALTGGSDTSPSEGDVVVVSVHASSNANRGLFLPSGYTEIADRYVNDNYDAAVIAGWKVMGSTPDTVGTVGAGSSIDSGGCLVAVASVWRGIDASNVEDVANAAHNSINTVMADSDAITPVTDGALILTFVSGAHNRGNQSYSSSNMDEVHKANRNASRDLSMLCGKHDWVTADGTFTPAALSWTGTDDLQFSFTTITAAFRPAAASGSVGAASGTSTVSGVGQTVIEGVGTAAGAATVTAAGQTIVEGVGSAAGTSSAAAVGGVGSVGTAAGIATAAAAGQTVVETAGTAAGDATVSGVGQTVMESVGAADGTSSAAAIAGGGSVGVADGIAAVSGVGETIVEGVGSAAGTSSAAAVAEGGSVGAASGDATVSGIGQTVIEGVGASAGIATLTAAGQTIIEGVGTSVGLSDAVGIGQTVIEAVGVAEGTSDAAGVGNDGIIPVITHALIPTRFAPSVRVLNTAGTVRVLDRPHTVRIVGGFAP